MPGCFSCVRVQYPWQSSAPRCVSSDISRAADLYTLPRVPNSSSDRNLRSAAQLTACQSGTGSVYIGLQVP